MSQRREYARLGWFLFASLLVTVFALRFAIGIKTEGVSQLFGLCLAVLGALILAAITEFFSQYRLRRYASRNGLDHVWRVLSGGRMQYLVVTDEAVALRNGSDRVRRSWARDQVRGVAEVEVRTGIRKRPALRIDLGVHQTHSSVTLMFPTWWSIRDDKDGMRSALRLVSKTPFEHPHG